MKKSLLLGIAVTGFLFSCTPQTGKAETGTATSMSLPSTSENIAQGKEIFEGNCGKCHDLPNPTKFTDEKWVGIMNWMAPKAKLDNNQKALAFTYVTNSN